MKLATIQTLNALNSNFYKKVGVEFDRTRQQYWEGWDNLQPNLENLAKVKGSLSVLDLACGNGRFGRFLAEKLPNANIDYHAVDREPILLDFTKKVTDDFSLKSQINSVDIVQSLIDNNLLESLHTSYDVIVVFGLLHHIPSLELRNKLIHDLSKLISANGLLILSSWQFALLPRFSERFIDPSVVGMNANDFEKNDHILDWKRVDTAYRYCHFADETELRQLVSENTDLKIKSSFYADGKTHSLNCYLIAEKS